jgi:serine/threonine-protein kinase
VADESRVQQLLDEISDSGCTPEAVCGACPELLPEVRRRWRQMCAVEAELDALFPTPGPDLDPGADRPVPWHAGADLPRIPGYDVEASLGRGGMGLVYKARHLRLNRLVALKMLLGGAYAGPSERARFRREAEAVASLRHPNIVQIYDVGDHEGCPYFTMELLEGGSLAQTLAGTPQSAHQAAALLATLAEAVQVAHRGGIVHRDLKPANILLTAEGTPKVADFGLARHFDEGPALTLSGARIGTPSYMAPEQVIGKPETIGPAADIYALGALLYELLTGRPPFRAETATETERQVIAEEPVPPARLNPKVPRDLETICLKCLNKDPQRRYATVAGLAEDLKRFQQHEPIAARRAGLLERTVKWVRRHPTPSAILAASFLLVMMLVGGSLWLAVQQAHRRDRVEADLKEMAALRDSARWAEARAALERAEDRLEGGGPGDLRRRLGQARRDLDLVIHLEGIRLKRVTRGELAFYKTQANRDYAEAFEQAGLGTSRDQPSLVAARIDASDVRGSLVAAVYDWAVCAADKEQRGWLLEVARHTQSDQDAWRERVLDPPTWENTQALTELAQNAPVAEQPVSLLLALGERLKTTGAESVPFLKRVHHEHPADFWANLILGRAMVQRSPQEAAGYYWAALASRPGMAVGYCAVGDAMRLQNALGEAIDYYKKALRLDAGYSRAQSGLGLALQAQDHLDEAIACYRTAVQLDPDFGWAHYNLGHALRLKCRLDEACDHYQQVVRVDPRNPEIHNYLACVLVPQGRGQEAQAGWRRALDANPHDFTAWAGYAELCLFLGRDEEYRRARRGLLARFGATTAPAVAEPVGRACLLLPGTEDELRQAAGLTEVAFGAKRSTPPWIYRYYLFAKGLAEYRQGRLASAFSLMAGEASEVMGPAPGLIRAMVQHRQGQTQQARRTLARAIIAFDWSTTQADFRDVWILHILRREAETLILPDLPAIRRGEHQALDNDERLALVGVCQSQGLYHTAARIYADAFAADPNFPEHLTEGFRSWVARTEQPVGRVEELTTECRYPAARCAALAGCGLGNDETKPDEAERMRWRERARDWLRTDLAVWARTLDGGSRAARVLVRNKLTHWLADPDLAGVRDVGTVEKLSVQERDRWRALWKEVDALLERTTSR